jgi:hypothetical protein
MTRAAPDDLEAVRSVVAALKDFEVKDQERVLRWAREKLGLPSTSASIASLASPKPSLEPVLAPTAAGLVHTSNIKTFIELKNPKSDRQFAATVAYFYKFEAPEAERKPSVTSADLQDACRKAGRVRLKNPAQTLLNAHAQGYLDKAGERGSYALNTVGENLVAMTLPETTAGIRTAAKRRNSKTQKKDGRTSKPFRRRTRKRG